jgi:hypothetical protein
MRTCRHHYAGVASGRSNNEHTAERQWLRGHHAGSTHNERAFNRQRRLRGYHPGAADNLCYPTGNGAYMVTRPQIGGTYGR